MQRAGRLAVAAAVTVVVVACVCAVPGCRSLRGVPSRVVVTHLGGDVFGVRGARVQLADLPAALRRRGCNANTGIEVSIASSTPRTTLAAVSGKLSAAGFRKVMFVKPLRADAFVGGGGGGSGE